MGISYQITCRKTARSFQLDTQELDALIRSTEHDKDLKRAMTTVFGPMKSETKMQCRITSFLTAIDALEPCAKGMIVITYSIWEGGGHGLPPGKSSRICGIRIDGKIYCLIGGIDRCLLEQQRLSDDGKRVDIISRQDVRHLSRIQTDNMGTLKILKRTKAGHMLRMFAEMKRFLSSHPSEENMSILIG